MNKIEQVGIVPPWLGDDIPHIMVEGGAHLPALPTPPAPPDLDIERERDLGTE